MAAAGGGSAKLRLEDFDVQGEISKGSFGTVYKIVRKADGRVFALKQVKLAGMKRVDRQEAIDEARLLSQLNHPNITMHYDSFIDKDDKLNIIMEYASKGNVAALIKNNRGKGLPEDTVWRILIQATLGLAHIHSKKIIHRDIKALNLFLDSQNNIKIGDLGIARALSDGSDFARTIVGTPYYLAPELCEDKPYNEKSDIWALGVVIYECCTGHYPFEAQNEGALIRKILRGQFTPISGPYTASFVQLASSLMTRKPEQRPDTNTLLRNPTLIAKAKALGIDLYPRITGSTEDKQPVYEPRGGLAGPSQQLQQPAGAVAAHPVAGVQYPAAQQYNLPGGQQYGRPASGRPVSAGPHPFDLPPQQHHSQQQGGGGYGYPPQQQYGQYLQGVPPGGQQQYPYQQGQGQPGRQQVVVPQNQPYAVHQGPPGSQPPQDPWDMMADEIQKFQLGTAEFNRVNAERLRNLQANVHQGRRDNVKEVFGHPEAPTPVNNRLRPEELPAAGMRGGTPNKASPYALHYQGPSMATMTQMQSSQVWTAKYSPPQYGRKRCPELQITGPSMRGSIGGRPGSARAGGGFVGAADDATTYVSSSYATYMR